MQHILIICNCFLLNFFGHFRVNRSSRANEYFSGLADKILDRFPKQKLALNIFLKWVFLLGKNFALGLKASRVLAMSIILFSFDSFSFSIFIDDFCVLAWTVQLICWSGRVRLGFSFNFLSSISGLVRLCFLLRWTKKCFALPHFAAFSTFCVKSFWLL